MYSFFVLKLGRQARNRQRFPAHFCDTSTFWGVGAPGECGPEQSLNIKFMICSNSVQTLFKQCSNNVQIQTLFIHCSNSFIKIQTLFKVCSIFVLPFSWSDLEGKLCSQIVEVQGSQKCHIHIVFKLCSSYNFKFILCSNFVQTLFNVEWIELLQKSNSYSVQTLFKI